MCNFYIFRIRNPFTAMLVPSLGEKTHNKSANFEIIMAFSPIRISMWKDFYENAHYWK